MDKAEAAVRKWLTSNTTVLARNNGPVVSLLTRLLADCELEEAGAMFRKAAAKHPSNPAMSDKEWDKGGRAMHKLVRDAAE